MRPNWTTGRVSEWGRNSVLSTAITATKSHSLIADSTALNGVVWQASREIPALAGEPNFNAGAYVQYGLRTPITANSNQGARNSSDAQTLTLWPFWSERPMKLGAILQRVHTLQASLSCKVGLYSAPDWPTMTSSNQVSFDLVADYGTFDCGSTGDKIVTGSTTVHGLFFLALYVPTTASAVRLNQASLIFQPFWTNSTNTISYWCFRDTGNYDSGLPSTVSAGTQGSNSLTPSVYAILSTP